MPSTSLTKERFLFKRAFRMEDLPTLTRPMMPIFMVVDSSCLQFVLGYSFALF